MDEKKGILNLLQVISAIKILGVAGVGISHDGIGAEDLPKALELIKQYETFISVAKNLSESISEAKDIDSAEAVQIVVSLIDAVKAIKAA